ncbi:mercuric ion transport protein [Bradyrhizobium sp. USDA 4011]|jgi:mercuric ion transport protein|uniref:Mercury resistance system transport protein MerF n=4 Tax=Bosea TaxID=85413 RepID=A0A927EAM7_9HYPH|nr:MULTISPECIES: mercury resistance system transport protein MerF [Hyphomicrobiales]RTM15407.1 MAG: mercury resistance system transport protein MerF [Bradyrhizobiaceae bacterium]CAH1663495.1 Mercury resistance system transport protein MerF [Hyphomicrobiales bacterium]MBD3847403.1 mercury resistance system transport protein MerF [Bosea spartocytisi]MBS7743649.1 mercury resistance system transport protein MerF [Chelatococcus sp. HY11]MBX3546448.1 mercury resistance system transport protein MerF 
MNDLALVRTGVAGGIIAAICCVTPILAVLLPLVGLGAWLVSADLMAFSLLAVSLGLIAWGLYRRRANAACGESKNHKEA